MTGIRIEECINAGYIAGMIGTGGLAGTTNGRIRNSINIGVVEYLPCNNPQYVGGIVGESYHQSGDPRVENCYYDKQLCVYGGIGNTGMGFDSVGLAEGRLTHEMLGNQLQSVLGNTN
jgi:hypothetical protein